MAGLYIDYLSQRDLYLAGCEMNVKTTCVSKLFKKIIRATQMSAYTCEGIGVYN